MSDGTHFLYGECAPDLRPLIHDHVVAQNAIVRVRQFAMSDRGGRRICTLFEAERVAPNPGERLIYIIISTTCLVIPT